MWCKNCRQDVPGLASLDEGAFHCARCGARVGRRRSSRVETSLLADDICDQGIDLLEAHEETCPTKTLHQWADDEHLENVRRLLRPMSVNAAPVGRTALEEAGRIRFDPPASQALRVPLPQSAEPLPLPSAVPLTAAGSGPLRMKTARPVVAAPVGHPAVRPAVSPTRSASVGIFASVASCVSSFGSMGLVCGGVLMGWSLATDRVELWKFGLPIAIVGQCILFIGILLTYGAKGAGRRKTLSPTYSKSLPTANESLDEASSAPVILADLRSQIERLSAQLSSSQRTS